LAAAAAAQPLTVKRLLLVLVRQAAAVLGL
jgi:hypothetical protein